MSRATAEQAESDVVAECVRWMQRQGWRARRNHVLHPAYNKRGQCVGNIGETGEADWTFMRPAQVVFVEFKRPGAKPEKHQLEWMAKMRHLGYHAGWCDSLAGLQALLAEWGLTSA